MLYGAPWFMTLFASTFEVGFVARVIDLLLADTPGTCALFKVAIILLGAQTIRDCGFNRIDQSEDQHVLPFRLLAAGFI